MNARIMVLGTGHWSNPGLDYKTTEHDDMLAAERQRQIAWCLDKLQQFSPTKIAIEITSDAPGDLDAEYRAYLAGDFSLTANERHQLGFRLARLMEHPRIYGVDWHDRERSIGWETAIQFAYAHGQDELVTFFDDVDAEVERAEERARVRQMSVRQMLLELNDPEGSTRGHRVYADLALVGEDSNYIGADVILRWYERNMKIFVNISRLIESPNDRVVVIIGAGHLPLLRHFIEMSGRFEFVSPVTYLS